MTKEQAKVLSFLLKRRRMGQSAFNVFDLMYETCFDYPKLKKILTWLCGEGHIVQIDEKTYEYVGDGGLAEGLIKEFYENNPPQSATKAKPAVKPVYVDRLEELRKRRDELMRQAEERIAAQNAAEEQDGEEDGDPPLVGGGEDEEDD